MKMSSKQTDARAPER